jgi:hypothetical protein
MATVFCAEDQPGGPNGGFPHSHRTDAPDYAHGPTGHSGVRSPPTPGARSTPAWTGNSRPHRRRTADHAVMRRSLAVCWPCSCSRVALQRRRVPRSPALRLPGRTPRGPGRTPPRWPSSRST